MGEREDAGVSGGSVLELVGFSEALARRLCDLRASSGLSASQVCASVRATKDELASFEAGAWKPSAAKLLRFAELYGVSLADVLVGAAREARATLGERFDPVAETMMLFAGVTPEQFAGEGLRVAEDDSLTASKVLHSKDYNPSRVRTALTLRRKYESGLSIRQLAESNGISASTARNLLIEAGATLRAQGGNHRRKR